MGYERASTSIFPRWRLILGAFLGLVAITVVVLFLIGRHQAREEKAGAALSKVQKTFSAKIVPPKDQADPTAKDDDSYPSQEEKGKALAEDLSALKTASKGLPIQKVGNIYALLGDLQNGRIKEGKAGLEEALKANTGKPLYPFLLRIRAHLALGEGDMVAGEADLKTLSEGDWQLFPPVAAQFELAQLYEEEGKASEARKWYKKVVDSLPKDNSNYMGLQAKSKLTLLPEK